MPSQFPDESSHTIAMKPELKERIQRSIQRLGFDHVVISEIDEGQIVLASPSSDRNDHCLIKAAVLTVSGVHSVTIESAAASASEET